MLCSMDFIPVTFSSFWTTASWAFIAIYVAPLVVMVLGLILNQSKKHVNAGTLITIVGLAAFAAVAVTSLVTTAQEFERGEKVKAEVAQTLSSLYGTDISADDLGRNGLEYPEERPEKAFEVFGSITQDAEKAEGGFERQTIYLIWQEEELRLAESADGEVFDVLGN